MCIVSQPTCDLEVYILTGVPDPKTRASAPTKQYNFCKFDAGVFYEWVANAPAICIKIEDKFTIYSQVIPRMQSHFWILEAIFRSRMKSRGWRIISYNLLPITNPSGLLGVHGVGGFLRYQLVHFSSKLWTRLLLRVTLMTTFLLG